MPVRLTIQIGYQTHYRLFNQFKKDLYCACSNKKHLVARRFATTNQTSHCPDACSTMGYYAQLPAAFQGQRKSYLIPAEDLPIQMDKVISLDGDIIRRWSYTTHVWLLFLTVFIVCSICEIKSSLYIIIADICSLLALLLIHLVVKESRSGWFSLRFAFLILCLKENKIYYKSF